MMMKLAPLAFDNGLLTVNKKLLLFDAFDNMKQGKLNKCDLEALVSELLSQNNYLLSTPTQNMCLFISNCVDKILQDFGGS